MKVRANINKDDNEKLKIEYSKKLNKELTNEEAVKALLHDALMSLFKNKGDEND